jgi:hypothetical protein
MNAAWIHAESYGRRAKIYNEAYSIDSINYTLYHEFAHVTPEVHAILQCPLTDTNVSVARWKMSKVMKFVRTGKGLCGL